MIGAARPSIADPFLPKKIEEGRLDDIRECIGCNICVTGDFTSRSSRCTQNPTHGGMAQGLAPERMRAKGDAIRSVLIVGAGPAGLEAARALGLRGYEVALAEAGPSSAAASPANAACPASPPGAACATSASGQISQDAECRRSISIQAVDRRRYRWNSASSSRDRDRLDMAARRRGALLMSCRSPIDAAHAGLHARRPDGRQAADAATSCSSTTTTITWAACWRSCWCATARAGDLRDAVRRGVRLEPQHAGAGLHPGAPARARRRDHVNRA